MFIKLTVSSKVLFAKLKLTTTRQRSGLFYFFFLPYFTSFRNHLGFSLFLSCFMWVICWWEMGGPVRKNGPGRVDIWNTNPAMQHGLILPLSYLGKFSNCHGEKRTCTHPETHTNETPSSEKPVTGNWLRHRNLLTSFVTFRRFLLPQSPRTLHPTVLGWNFYQPSAYIFSSSSVNQS